MWLHHSRFVPMKNRDLWYIFLWAEDVQGAEIHTSLHTQYGDNALFSKKCIQVDRNVQERPHKYD
jgi:GTP-dependent phosphoenolpyruvate carboxykinase